MNSAAPVNSAADIASRLYQNVCGTYTADIVTTESGSVAGMEFLDPTATPAPAGQWRLLVENGQRVDAGQALLTITGTATELGVAEDYVMGSLGFACGIATPLPFDQSLIPARAEYRLWRLEKTPCSPKATAAQCPVQRRHSAATGPGRIRVPQQECSDPAGRCGRRH